MFVPTVVPLLPFEEFARLWRKALTEGVQIEQHPTRPGVYLATSGSGRTYNDSHPVKYTVTADGCSCPAGVNGKHCKHYALGLQTMYEEEANGIGIELWEMQTWVVQHRSIAVAIPAGATQVTAHKPAGSSSNQGSRQW